MATHFIDPEGRSHWADEGSNFAVSGLESGHLRRAGEPVSDAAKQTDDVPAEPGSPTALAEELEREKSQEAEDATVEQDGDGEDAVSDPDGSGDAKRAPSRSRQR